VPIPRELKAADNKEADGEPTRIHDGIQSPPSKLHRKQGRQGGIDDE
jgi:hypothetical protein